MNKYHLKIASGYKASMGLYGSKLLLCTELAHKLINLDSVWDVMENFYRNAGSEGYKQACMNHLIGQTVMTKYKYLSFNIFKSFSLMFYAMIATIKKLIESMTSTGHRMRPALFHYVKVEQ